MTFIKIAVVAVLCACAFGAGCLIGNDDDYWGGWHDGYSVCESETGDPDSCCPYWEDGVCTLEHDI